MICGGKFRVLSLLILIRALNCPFRRFGFPLCARLYNEIAAYNAKEPISLTMLILLSYNVCVLFFPIVI